MLESCIQLLCADASGLGRVNPQYLSEQDCVELLVSEMKTKRLFQNEDKNFHDFKDWKNVELHDNGVIKRIHWSIDPQAINLRRKGRQALSRVANFRKLSQTKISRQYNTDDFYSPKLRKRKSPDVIRYDSPRRFHKNKWSESGCHKGYPKF